ncbi:MAG: NAD(P)-dependent oxidoreductase, partial [Chitinophagaceae bacterium]
KLAAEGANIIVGAKSAELDPRLEGTIYTAAEEIEKAGGRALALKLDIRFEEQINEAVEQAMQKFGGIDILVNNASAINLSSTEQIESKKFDLMQSINVRGTFLMSKACIPHLRKSANPHILTLSPPLNMDPRWFKQHLAYTMSKYGMSMVTMGLAGEFKKDKIGVNSLWPKTTIATAAVQNLLGGEQLIQRSRTTGIVADAAAFILNRPAAECTGNFFVDEDVLTSEGITDFAQYAVNGEKRLMQDLFL